MPNGSTDSLREYTQEVLFDLVMLPHEWKNTFLARSRSERKDGRYHDVWEMLKALSFEWSQELWNHYSPLFSTGLQIIVDKGERSMMMHGQVIPIGMKLVLMRTMRTLRMESSVYLHLPQIVTLDTKVDMNPMITGRFQAVFDALAALSTTAERHRKAAADGAEQIVG